MATHKKIKGLLLEKLGCTPQALSQRCNKLKDELPMSTPDAVYVIAHDNGVKLDKHLDIDTLRHVRDLISKRSGGMQTKTKKKTKATKSSSTGHEIKFPNEFKINDPILPKSTLNAAKKMAAIYPLFFQIENSMREVIKRVLSEKYGPDWWDTNMTSGKLRTVKNNAEGRKRKEEKLSWHQNRGQHQIDYVDFKDLEVIICAKQADFFPSVISPDVDWFKNFMRELLPSRNVVCHMNPLLQVNIDDLKVKVKRWNTMIKNNIKNNHP